MSLDEHTRQDIILYRIEKAYSAYNDAEFVAQSGHVHMAANRLYYALYHAASALLLADGIPTHTHKGIMVQLSFNYVKNEKLAKEEGKLFSKMFSLRQEADYEDFIHITEEQISELIPQVKALLDKLTALNPFADATYTSTCLAT